MQNILINVNKFAIFTIFFVYRLTNRFMNRLTNRLPKLKRSVNRRLTYRLETLAPMDNYKLSKRLKYRKRAYAQCVLCINKRALSAQNNNKTKSNFRVELAVGSQKYGYFRNPEKILDKTRCSF